MRRQRKALCFCLAFWLSLLSAIPSHASPHIDPPAVLVTNNGSIASNIDVVSLLLGITWLRHDTATGTSTLVMPVMVNGGAAVLPGPVDGSGNPLMGSVNNPVSTLLPLFAAGAAPEFPNGEAVFFSAQYPSLANDPSVVDTASVRVRIYSTVGALLDEETLLVTETGLATGLFTGYFQNNPLAGGPGDGLIMLPPGARVEIVDTDDIADGSFDSQVDASIGEVNPGSPTLFVSKRAAREVVAAGDYLSYDIGVENSTIALAPGVAITDVLPRGFRYMPGSATLDGAPLANPTVSNDGRTLQFAVGNLATTQRVTLRYVVEVTAGARRGRAVNSASAATAGGVQSNVAQASVRIEEDLFRSDAFVVGRVTFDSCDAQADANTTGLADVRLYLEDGTTVVTDKFGRYHVAGIRPGVHVVQVDKASLPEDLELAPCTDNTRYAGNGYSQFLDVQGGGLFRVDFHARKAVRGPYEYDESGPAPTLVTPEKQAPAKSGLSLQLTSASEFGFIHYRAEIRGENAAQKNLALVVKLAEGMQVVRGSTKRDGVEATLVRENGIRTIPIGDVSGNFGTVIEFDTMSIGDGHDGSTVYSEGLTQAWLTADGLEKGRSPQAENSLRLGNGTGGDEVKVTVSTNFPPMSATLSALDKLKLDDVVTQLQGLEEAHLTVTGHTDNVPIPKSTKKKKFAYADNRALSEARAQAVADYLREQLALPEEVVTVVGAGAEKPLHSNKSAEGRAQNRRVEVAASSRTSREAGEVAVVRGDSGLQTVDLTPQVEEQAPVIVAAAEPAPVEPAPAETAQAEPEPEPEPEPEGEKLVPGFLDFNDGEHLAQRIQQVRVAMDSRLTPKLTVDDVEVPSVRIGYRGADPKTKMTLYSYIGVDFGARGEHKIRITGTDNFGNARLDQALTIVRTGDITDVRFIANGDNVADGKTPVTLKVELLDEKRRNIPASATLTLVESDLLPENSEDAINPLASTRDTIKVAPDGTIRFKPVTQSGRYHLRLSWAEGRAEDFTVFVKPHFRDWILVGIAEGSAAFHELSGNIAPLAPQERDEGFSVDGRAAFFARGKVKGEWLLTMTYDSDKPNTGRLADRIDPNAWYTLYGDTSSQELDAASMRKLYLKIERENFYALFGDFQTGMENTELSRYQRRLNGAKAEFWGNRVDVLAFVSETRQAYVRDDLRGDGTAGLYSLRYRGVVPGSETIRIETRDRFHASEVLESRALAPYVDYHFDADTGAIWFKEPVRAQDDGFNPVYIVAEYEVDNGVDGVTGGVRVVTRPLSGLQVGVTGVQEGVGNGNATLAGVDARYTLDSRNKFHAEIANTAGNLPAATTTPTGATGDGHAFLLGHEYRDGKLSVDSEVRETADGFGLGQQAASANAARNIGSRARYSLSDSLSVSGELSRAEQLDLNRTRDLAEARINLSRDELDVFSGVRVVRDDTAGTTSMRESQQLVAGVRQQMLQEKLQMKLEGETNIAEDDPNSVDYPHRLRAGIDYRLGQRSTLFVERELGWGDGQDSEHSRAGVRYVPWKGAQANTSVGRDLAENGPRVYANAGLVQNWALNSHWTADAGIDRVQTIQEPGTPAFDPDAAPTNGGTTEDFTAVFVGAGYQDLAWTWRGRLEVREGVTEDKLNLFSGLYRKLNDATTIGNSLRFLRADSANGDVNTSATLQFDYAWRPLAGKWIIFDQARYVIDLRDTAGDSLDGRRVVNNVNAHWQYDARNEVGLQYGGKYVFDTIDAVRYTGYTDLIGAEYRRDVTDHWHAGARTSLLHSWRGDAIDESVGVFVGYSPEENVQITVGYNLKGFRDDDFSGASYHDQGFNLGLRIKFDQDSVRKLGEGRSRLSAPRPDTPIVQSSP